jgi:hypothetical protein
MTICELPHMIQFTKSQQKIERSDFYRVAAYDSNTHFLVWASLFTNSSQNEVQQKVTDNDQIGFNRRSSDSYG